MKFKKLALVICLGLGISGCVEESQNQLNLTAENYKPTQKESLPMVFPGKGDTVFKTGQDANGKKAAKPYQHGNEWVIYVAAPSWTERDQQLVKRLTTAENYLRILRTMLADNNLSGKVKTAWLQYDQSPQKNFIGDFLVEGQGEGLTPPQLKGGDIPADYYIYSPASRYGNGGRHVEYAEWVRPYYWVSKKVDGKYVSSSIIHSEEGYEDNASKYWDRWPVHIFVVNPDGIVVDAFFESLGIRNGVHPYQALHTLIKHFEIDEDDVIVRNYQTAPKFHYFTQNYIDEDFETLTNLNNQR